MPGGRCLGYHQIEAGPADTLLREITAQGVIHAPFGFFLAVLVSVFFSHWKAHEYNDPALF